jgi:zinc protease
MDAALYLSHPYGTPVIGWEHEMRELSRQDALDFYKRFYAPNNAILVVAGDVTMQKVLELAKETYAKIEPVADVKAGKRPSEPPHMAARRIEIKDPRAGQANVRRDYYVPSYTTAGPGEAEALELLMKVLASGATGRVYKQLVIDGKLASSAGGWYSSYGKDSGELSFYAIAADGVSIDRVEAALSNVIADVVKNGVSEDELQRAKNALIADHVYDADSQNKLAQRYGWGLTIGQTIADIEEWPQRLEAVSLDAVNAVAKKHLRLKNSVTGILLPEQPEE